MDIIDEITVWEWSDWKVLTVMCQRPKSTSEKIMSKVFLQLIVIHFLFRSLPLHLSHTFITSIIVPCPSLHVVTWKVRPVALGFTESEPIVCGVKSDLFSI